MNVLLNYLELFERKGWVAPEAHGKLRTMRETLEKFIETSERARHIEQTLQDSEVVSLDIVTVVENCVADLHEEHPQATIDISAPDAVTVVADKHIDVAITELCENAIVHASSDQPTVSVNVTAAEVPGSVCLTVENEGDIPPATQAAITEGSEKPLQHSSGLGLWLVKWLVEQSYGQLTLREADDICQVQVRLPTTVPDTFGE
jgi:two-component sensor histidine kinase